MMSGLIFTQWVFLTEDSKMIKHATRLPIQEIIAQITDGRV